MPGINEGVWGLLLIPVRYASDSILLDIESSNFLNERKFFSAGSDESLLETWLLRSAITNVMASKWIRLITAQSPMVQKSPVEVISEPLHFRIDWDLGSTNCKCPALSSSHRRCRVENLVIVKTMAIYADKFKLHWKFVPQNPPKRDRPKGWNLIPLEGLGKDLICK